MNNKPNPSKKIEPVNIGKVELKKQTPGQKIKKAFGGINLKAAAQYSIEKVLIPEARRAISSTLINLVEKSFYGDTKGAPRTLGSANSTSNTRVRYDRISSNDPYYGTPIQMNTYQSNVTRIMDFTYETYEDACAVIDRVNNYLAQYRVITVQDFCEIVRVQFTFNDSNFGWTSFEGARPQPCVGGKYFIAMPAPQPLTTFR